MTGVIICEHCNNVDDSELGQRCPCHQYHDVTAARRRLREAIAQARRTDDVAARAREAAA